MTTDADLRRLAEQARDTYHDHAAVKVSDCPMCLFRDAANPQAILALLDERERWEHAYENARDDRQAAERRVAALTDALASAEARVSGLEEGLRALLDWLEQMDSMADDKYRPNPTVKVTAMLWKDKVRPLVQKARALLDPAALPAEATDE